MNKRLKEAMQTISETKIDNKRVQDGIDLLTDLLKSDLDVAKKNEKAVKEVLAMLEALQSVV